MFRTQFCREHLKYAETSTLHIHLFISIYLLFKTSNYSHLAFIKFFIQFVYCGMLVFNSKTNSESEDSKYKISKVGYSTYFVEDKF